MNESMTKDEALKRLASAYAFGLKEYGEYCWLCETFPDPMLVKRFTYDYQRHEAGVQFDFGLPCELVEAFGALADKMAVEGQPKYD
jgi:hypothetical protein